MKETVFCNECHHNVFDMTKHTTTEEHKRNLRRNGDGSLVSCPESYCSQRGCIHIRPHTKTDTCSKPGRGIINGCKKPCTQVDNG